MKTFTFKFNFPVWTPPFETRNLFYLVTCCSLHSFFSLQFSKEKMSRTLCKSKQIQGQYHHAVQFPLNGSEITHCTQQQLCLNSFRQFPALSKTSLWWVIMTTRDQLLPNHWIKNCPVIGKHVGVNFVSQEVTIAIIQPVKNTLNFSLKHF